MLSHSASLHSHSPGTLPMIRFAFLLLLCLIVLAAQPLAAEKLVPGERERVTLNGPWPQDVKDPVVWTRSVHFPASTGPAGVSLIIENPVGAIDVLLDDQRIDQFLGTGMLHRTRIAGTANAAHTLILRLDPSSMPESMRTAFCGFGPVSLEVLPVTRIEALTLIFPPSGDNVSVRYRIATDEPCQATLSLNILSGDSRHPVKRVTPLTLDVPLTGATGTVSFHVKSLAPWRMRSRKLYYLQAQLTVQKKIVDLFTATCGHCRIRLNHEGRVEVNGETLTIKGMCFPGGFPVLSDGENLAAVLKREFTVLRSAGYTAIMSDGASLPSEALDVADTLGLFVFITLPPAATTTQLMDDFSAAVEAFANHPCVIGWNIQAPPDVTIDLSALQQRDPARMFMVHDNGGDRLLAPTMTNAMRMTVLDWRTREEAAVWQDGLKHAAGETMPLLVCGTPRGVMADDAIVGQQDEERRLQQIREVVETVRGGHSPFGYFVRPPQGGTLTGLTNPAGENTLAYFSALAYNQSRLLAIRVWQEGSLLRHEVRLINDAPRLDRNCQLYRLVTTPDNRTVIGGATMDNEVLVTGARVQDYSDALPPMTIQTPGTYRVQFVLSDRGKVVALSQVVTVDVE